MANFVKHAPCPQCNSKDNLAIYDDGSTWCFGCSVSTKGTHKPTDVEYAGEKKFWYPSDITKTLPYANKAWLQSYDLFLTEVELFSYSAKLDRHVYTIYNEEGTITMWEGRSLITKPKSLIIGSKPYHIVNPHGLETVCICEDIISAIKIGRHTSCMPLFGSKLRLDYLARLSKEYNNLKIWLDHDKFDEAMNIMIQANNLGMKADVIFTHRDPKEYSNEVIKRKVDA